MCLQGFCSDNTLGYHCQLSIWPPWDGDIISPLQCTLLYNGKGKKSFAVKFPPYFFTSPQEKEGVEAVSVGAILSDYQRVRVENV